MFPTTAPITMTFYDKCTTLSEVIIVLKDEYQSHNEQ